MSDSNWDEEFHDSVESVVKLTSDDFMVTDTKYLDAFEKGRVFERDKQKEELIKAIKSIKEELHDLNRSLKRR